MVKEVRAKKNKTNVFRLAGIAGLLMVILSVIGVIVSSLLAGNLALSSKWSLIQGVLVNLAMLFFTWGFYALGKKYNSTLLKVVSILTIIFIIVSYLFNLYALSPATNNLLNIALDKTSSLGMDLNNISETEQNALGQALISDSQFTTTVYAVLGLIILYVLVLAVLSILLGVALVRLGEKVKYAKVTGILEIVGGATVIILIGVIPLIIAFVYELIILFDESKK